MADVKWIKILTDILFDDEKSSPNRNFTRSR